MIRRLAASGLGRLATTLAPRQRLARRLLALVQLVPGRSPRARLYQVFSWPLAEEVRGRYEVETVAGRMLVEPQTPIGRVLTVSGEWEPHVTAALSRRLETGDVCIDVGAHVGYYALLASKGVGPSGHVYAVEPSARVFEDLSSNLALNGATNVTAVNRAAGEDTGVAVLYEAPGPSPLTSSLCSRMLEMPHAARAEEFVATEVPLATVDGIVPEHLRARVRVVKIDVEGYEIEVLRGMSSILGSAGRLAVFVETSPDWANVDPASSLTELCETYGLSAYVLRNDYTLEGYFPRRLVAPTRVSTIPRERTDLMLVRDGRRRDA